MSAPLNSLTTGSYANLEWRPRKGARRDSELRADGRAIGTACWTFKRIGFFQQRVEVRACDAEEPLAEFVNATWSGGGTLTMRGGGLFRLSAHIKIASEARALPELLLLVALSWYLVLMLAEDSAAVG